ncbi:hypothetical protein ACQPZJ_27345 [Actinoplanes sp. CA-054009]
MRSRLWIGAAAVVAGAVLIGTGTALARGARGEVRAEHARPSPPASAGRPASRPAAPTFPAITHPSATSAAPAVTSARPATTRRPAVPAISAPAAAACGAGTFEAEVVKSGDTWTSRNGDRVVYTGTDMLAAIQTSVNNLTPGRTSKERVVVRGSGTVKANQWIRLWDYTVLDVCGTITAIGDGAYDYGLIYARAVHDIEVQHLTMKSSSYYGVFLRDVANVKLGRIAINGTYIGVRIDVAKNSTNWSRDVTVDDLTVSNTLSQGMETLRVDGLKVGTVTAHDTGESGLLLNTTVNAEIGTVDGDNAGAGTGYAAFRMANRNGRIGDSYATNVHVGLVRARQGGRGVFCVSESGGALIDRVDIAGTGNHPVLIENCSNVTIASGSITGPGDIRIAARAELPVTSDVTLKNLTVTNARIVETPCSARFTVTGVKLVDATVQRC